MRCMGAVLKPTGRLCGSRAPLRLQAGGRGARRAGGGKMVSAAGLTGINRAALHSTPPRISQEVSIQFNLCNEPWLKYTLSAIADKGMKQPGWTSARLRSEVLFLETNWCVGWLAGRLRIRTRHTPAGLLRVAGGGRPAALLEGLENVPNLVSVVVSSSKHYLHEPRGGIRCKGRSRAS
jgi:hypothetical protein